LSYFYISFHKVIYINKAYPLSHALLAHRERERGTLNLSRTIKLGLCFGIADLIAPSNFKHFGAQISIA
jgi:hypothetical protein